MLREGGKRRPAKAVPRGAHAWSCILHPALRGLRCKEDCTWKCCVHLGGIIECFIHHSAAVFSCKKKKKKNSNNKKVKIQWEEEEKGLFCSGSGAGGSRLPTAHQQCCTPCRRRCPVHAELQRGWCAVGRGVWCSCVCLQIPPPKTGWGFSPRSAL